MKRQTAWYQDKKIIRIFCFLPKKLAEISKNIIYKSKPYSKEIKKLKGQYADKRCFIIGNGPSLSANDLELIKGHYSFGVNKIYHIFEQTTWRPTFYVCVDNRALYECYDIMKETSSQCFWDYSIAKYRNYHALNNNYLINNRQHFYVDRFKENRIPLFSDDVSNFIEAGETVIFNAVQIAAYLGFKTIVLLGVDCNYSKVFLPNGKIKKQSESCSYFSNKLDSKNENVSNLIGQINAFRSVHEYCVKHSIKIIDATRNGKLTIFPKKDLEELLL